jgi:hypothetical protein
MKPMNPTQRSPNDVRWNRAKLFWEPFLYEKLWQTLKLANQAKGRYADGLTEARSQFLKHSGGETGINAMNLKKYFRPKIV